MERRHFIKLGGYGALSLLAARSLPGYAQDFKLEEIRKGVGYFTEAGGTIGWLRSADGWVIVDAQFPHSAGHLVGQLKRTSPKFKALINTHHHGDHTAGNIVFKGLVKQAYAHENALQNLKNTTEDDSKMFYPKKTFSDQKIIRAGSETIQLSYLGPGHTNGDAIVHFQNANVVHMGDLMFNRRFPYIDKSAGADIGSWIQILGTCQSRFDSDTVFIFGHAGDNWPVTGNHDDLAAFQNYLQRLLDYVSKAKKNGKTKEHLLQSEFIPGAEEWKGKGIERSIQAAWEEV